MKLFQNRSKVITRVTMDVFVSGVFVKDVFVSDVFAVFVNTEVPHTLLRTTLPDRVRSLEKPDNRLVSVYYSLRYCRNLVFITDVEESDFNTGVNYESLFSKF